MVAMQETAFILTPTGAVLLLLAGTVAGFINMLAGGGSLLTLPLMVLLGLPGNQANGTNRIALLAQNISGSISFRRRGVHDLRKSMLFAMIALPGAALGAALGTSFSGPWFNRFLAVVMLLVLVFTACTKSGATVAELSDAPLTGRRRLVSYIAIFAAGLYGGFIQAGVGFILIAILYRGMRMSLTYVNMHKIFIIGVYSLVALCIFAWRGQVCWAAGACLAVGNSAGAWVGAHVAVKKGDPLIRMVFNIVVVVMAIALILRSF